MRTGRSACLLLLAAAMACGGGAPASPATPAPVVGQPLAGVAAQALIVTPVQSVAVVSGHAWSASIRPLAEIASLDSAIASALRSRVGHQGWVYFDGLVQSYNNNRTYAANPRSLSAAPLRLTTLKVEDRLPEPLASQLRTMIALHDARLVLIPVELKFARTDSGAGRPTLRVVLVDPRLSVVRWIGEVTGDESPTFNPAYTADIAGRLADLFVAR